jgi:IS605 OrfB family transposase
VARLHERIGRRRGRFAHQHSERIVNTFDLIAVEDWSVNRMKHNHGLAKSIHDAAWRQFADLLAYKAAWAGRQYVAVYESDFLAVWPSARALARRPHLHLPLMWAGARPRPERQSDHFGIGATMSGFGLEAPGFSRGESSRGNTSTAGT